MHAAADPPHRDSATNDPSSIAKRMPPEVWRLAMILIAFVCWIGFLIWNAWRP